MDIFRTVESKLAGLLEGGFGRMFRSEVRPMEIAHKLVREMDEHRTSSVTRVYVPNEYLVWLSPEDRARYQQVEDEVIDELCAYLLEHARREELTLASRPVITFNTDEQLSLGEFGIQARMVHEEDDDSGELRQAEHGHTMIYSAAARFRGTSEQPEHEQQRAFVLADGKRLVVPRRGATVGRSRNCDIVLDDAGVSRQHAKVIRWGESWAIEDLGSTNGLHVNGSTVSEPRELHDGDRIQLGNTEIVFQLR
jgi:FHA domain-containing protein